MMIKLPSNSTYNLTLRGNRLDGRYLKGGATIYPDGQKVDFVCS